MHSDKYYQIKYVMLICLLLFWLGMLSATGYQTHKVRKGDTLYGLAKRYGVTVDNLKKLNKLSADNLSLGQVLKIKPETVKPKPKPEKQPAPVVADKKTPAAKPVTTPEQNPQTPVSPPSAAGDPAVQSVLTNLPDDYYHVVLPKENLFRIALNANIPLPDLLKFNQFPDAHVMIKAGQKVLIKDPALFSSSTPATDLSISPSPNSSDAVLSAVPEDSVVIEKVYIVQRKDTLFKIAKANNMTVEELKKRNNLSDNSISVGQKLYIVGKKSESEPEAVPVIVTEEDLKAKTKLRTDLIMPVDGKVISEYGIRNGRPHKGIDLGAPTGSPIFSVLDGTVVYAGLQGNYGNVVVVEHPDFIMSVYGHNEKNLVNVGDVVKQGQIIATTGSTGNATAPHVHFEYRIKGKAINPRKVLPIGG